MSENNKILMIGYDEIGLKGRNQRDFINKLIHNITLATGLRQEDLQHRQGRIYGKISDDQHTFVSEQLQKVFGIKWFTFADLLPHQYDALQKAALDTAAAKKKEGARSFKIDARRSNKDFYLDSHEINVELGDDIRVEAELEVDVHDPDVTFYVEVRKKHIYLYTDPVDGPGGLPVGSNGKVLMLMSGGIDSPAAAWSLMKRGLSVDCVYFHSSPYTGEKALEKVRKLTRIISEWNGDPITLYIPHFTQIQEEMVETVPESMWTVSQRRYMHLIADKLVNKFDYMGLATGDSVGQVASQTLENLQLIDEVTETIVLRPLTGYDKEEIINLAKNIGTFETSIEPYEDCCVMFAPGRPSTRVQSDKLEYFEDKLTTEKLIDSALNKLQTETYSRLEEQVDFIPAENVTEDI